MEGGAGLRSISCVSEAFCVALDASAGALVDHNGSWSERTVLGGGGGVSRFSCASSTFCELIDTNGHTFSYDGASWSQGVSTGVEDLRGLSCVSASFCVAVRTTFHEGPPWFQGEAFTFDGVAWSAPSVITPVSSVDSVSCASATFCAAVGSEATIYNGSGWSTPVSDTGLSSVSCPQEGFCLGIRSGYFSWFESGSWSTPVPISTAAAKESFEGGVSCASSTFCVALSNHGQSYIYNGTSWTKKIVSKNKNYFPWNSISCASSSFCVAIDHGSQFSVFNGSSWSKPTLVWGLNTDVDCPTTSFCVGLSNYNEVFYGTEP